MLIRELMIPKPPVLTPQTTLPEALSLMQEKLVHRMPVVDSHGVLVGIISDTDLHNATPSSATLLSFWEIPALLAKIKVEMVMVKEVATVSEDTPVEEAARIMADRNVGSLVVLNGKKLVGMVNQSDVFGTFMELMGGRRKGVRIWATTATGKGVVAKITTAIAEASGSIVGLGIQEVTDAEGARWEITLKVQDLSKERLVDVLKPHLVDILDVRES